MTKLAFPSAWWQYRLAVAFPRSVTFLRPCAHCPRCLRISLRAEPLSGAARPVGVPFPYGGGALPEQLSHGRPRSAAPGTATPGGPNSARCAYSRLVTRTHWKWAFSVITEPCRLLLALPRPVRPPYGCTERPSPAPRGPAAPPPAPAR